MTAFRTLLWSSLLILLSTASICREEQPPGTAPAGEEAPAAFASPENARRYYTQVRWIFPEAAFPAEFAMAPPEGEGEEAGGEGEEEEEEEEPGPPPVPRPNVREGQWRSVARSGNWAGVPQGGERLCPCETDFLVKLSTTHFNADPRRPNPPAPDPGNGLFPAVWRNCLAAAPAPQGAPDHPCTEPCRWKSTRIDDWSLDNEPNGAWRLTCWKLLVFHCELDSLPPGDISSSAELVRGVPRL